MDHRATGTTDFQTQGSLGCSSDPCEQVLPPRCSPWSLHREGTRGGALSLGLQVPAPTVHSAPPRVLMPSPGSGVGDARGGPSGDGHGWTPKWRLLRSQPPCTGRKRCPQTCPLLALIHPSALCLALSCPHNVASWSCGGGAGCACPWPTLWGSCSVPSQPQGACGLGGRKDSKGRSCPV